MHFCWGRTQHFLPSPRARLELRSPYLVTRTSTRLHARQLSSIVFCRVLASMSVPADQSTTNEAQQTAVIKPAAAATTAADAHATTQQVQPAGGPGREQPNPLSKNQQKKRRRIEKCVALQPCLSCTACTTPPHTTRAGQIPGQQGHEEAGCEGTQRAGVGSALSSHQGQAGQHDG